MGRKIYQFEYTEYTDGGSKADGYVFLIALYTNEAMQLIVEAAKEREIFYVFGESDIVMEQSIDEMPNGVFEVIFAKS